MSLIINYLVIIYFFIKKINRKFLSERLLSRVCIVVVTIKFVWNLSTWRDGNVGDGVSLEDEKLISAYNNSNNNDKITSVVFLSARTTTGRRVLFSRLDCIVDIARAVRRSRGQCGPEGGFFANAT